MGGFSSVELHVTRCSGSYRRAWAQGVFRKMQRSLDSWTEDLNRLRWSRVTKSTATPSLRSQKMTISGLRVSAKTPSRFKISYISVRHLLALTDCFLCCMPSPTTRVIG